MAPNLPAWAHPYDNPFVFYADGGDDPAPEGGAAVEPPKPGPPATKTFTQDEVVALAAKEKSQGERAGARKALEDLAAKHGLNSATDIDEFIGLARQAQQDALSEEEKRRAELERREQDLVAREAAAVARERAANRRSALVGLGATGDDLEDAAALLRVEDDADDTAIAEAAEKLKARRPELFGAAKQQTDPNAAPPAPTGLPASGMPRPGATNAKPGDRGLEMLRRRGKLPAA